LAEKKAQEAAEQAAADPEGTAAAEAAAGDSQGGRGEDCLKLMNLRI